MGLIPRKEDLDTALVLSAVKDAMKTKGISYKDLADRIGMSESGLKKLFISKDCSFNRLVKITQAIDLPLVDILMTLRSEAAREVDFTPEQEDFFVENPSCFRFYWKLVIERYSVKDLQQKFALTDSQVFHFLRQLDELELIEVHENNRVKLPKFELIRWSGRGSLVRKVREDWSVNLVKEALSSEKDGQHFSLRSYQLTSESIQDLLRALKDLDIEFGRRSIREMILHKTKLKFVRTLAVLAEGSYVERL